MRLPKLYSSALLLPLLLVAGAAFPFQQAQAQAGSRLFPETGMTVQGRFYQYWQQHGGLAQQGLPISQEMQEVSETDGKTYTVQYFERAVFEAHPENPAPNDVLLSLLGVFRYSQKYPGGAPNQQPNASAGSVVFSQTGKRLGGLFLTYWQQHGGLAQQGYPISDEFTETSDLDGKPYKVQYFERAVFEYHPENQPPYNVLLSQLGTFRYHDKYGAGQPAPAPIIPTPVAGCSSNLVPGTWAGPFQWQFSLTTDRGLTGNGSVNAGISLNVSCDGAFTGTAVTSGYNAQGMIGGVTVLTCNSPENPVAQFNGRVVALPDGLHLAVLGGQWTAGAISCSNPLTASAPQTFDLKGQKIGANDVKVEGVSDGKITGTEWLADPALAIIKARVDQMLPNANVQITTTGHWELDYQSQNP